MRLSALAAFAIACRTSDKGGLDEAPLYNDTESHEDNDGDGYYDDDCDDAEGSINPGAAEICDGIDNDCDGETDEEVMDAFYADSDGDGFGDDASSAEGCEAPAGYVAVGGDCDDADGESYPGAAERCDSVDNDCDGAVDEDVTTEWYADADADGFGNPGAAVASCDPGAGYVADNSDCDDTDAGSFPGGDEVCDEADNDCDGETDEGVTTTYYADVDGDGFGADGKAAESCDPLTGYADVGGDCDDAEPGINPGASEVCDGLDNDCDASADEAGAEGEAAWYADADGDSYGDAGATDIACDPPSGYVADDTDCDDGEAGINPGEAEVCDEVDQDCDGTADEGVESAFYADADGDSYGDPGAAAGACEAPPGYVSDDTDCDDGEAGINPGEAEVCDGLDNDCDGTADEDSAADAATWYADADGDTYGDAGATDIACEQPAGYVSDDTDCDDAEAGVNPDASEVCDEVDQDCDGAVDEGVESTFYLDDDGDGHGDGGAWAQACEAPPGYVEAGDDCDDADADVSPSAPERCNWADDDCDGEEDEGLADADGSGIQDCKEIAVIFSYGFVASAGSYSCEGADMLAREAQAIEDALADLGLSPVFFEDDKSESLAWADVAAYPVVVYHNGGWSAAGSSSVVAALEEAAAAGKGLLLWGDDVLKHASAVQGAYGTSALFDLAYLTGYTSNGIIGLGAVVSDSSHPVMAGPAGTVEAFSFATDIDQASAAGAGESVLMTLDGYPANPVVVAADSGGQRTVTALVSVHNSSACPGSDAAGLVELETLFQNAAWWAGGW